ncbi:MAG TPA: glycerol-3-phosphate dehydrogenase/oxidase [Anaerolineales bacterium]
MNREAAMAWLRTRREVSVLIVGAGINGIGTFRDLALNGVDVLLIDRGDFCGGASAASSHMAHGGIRYLENGEFRLVREAVQERNLMIQNAAHIVRPLPTTIPIFRRLSGLLNAPLKFLGWLDRPSERGSLVIKVGLMLYDAYTGKKRVVPRHRFMNRTESLGRWPLLNPDIVNTATYYDGAILQPERLGVELVLDAEDGNPEAVAINYMSLEGRKGEAVVLRDGPTGNEFEIRPRLLINATGPWIDLSNERLGSRTRFIGGTKGSHVVLAHAELREAIGDHEFFFENQDGRIVLIFPLFDRVLIGTSDIPVGDPDDVRCTDEEVEYFLGLVKRVFPSIQVDRSQIVFRFSGVRPLAKSESKTTGQISRDHEICFTGDGAGEPPFPVYSLVGGKWTSWRAFAEQVTDRTLDRLGRSRSAGTQMMPIGGGKGYPTTEAERAKQVQRIAKSAVIPIQRAERLFERYGTRAQAVADYVRRGADQDLKALPEYSRREFQWLAEGEKVAHLDDVLLRRTMLAMLGKLSRSTVAEIAEALAPALGWNAEETDSETRRALEILKTHHQVEL